MRDKKTTLVESYKDIFNSSSIILIAKYSGITVSEFNTLRQELRRFSNSKAVVVKNTLARIAADSTVAKEVKDTFSGPVVLFYSSDPVGLSKGVVEFIDKHAKKLSIQVGMMDGKVLDERSVNALSKLPSLDALRAKIVATIAAPARNIASIIHNVPASVARVIQAKSEK